MSLSDPQRKELTRVFNRLAETLDEKQLKNLMWILDSILQYGPVPTTWHFYGLIQEKLKGAD